MDYANVISIRIHVRLVLVHVLIVGPVRVLAHRDELELQVGVRAALRLEVASRHEKQNLRLTVGKRREFFASAVAEVTGIGAKRVDQQGTEVAGGACLFSNPGVLA